MVMPFAPVSNDTADPCEGVEAYNAARPPINSDLAKVNFATFVITMIVWMIALSILWAWRDKPRFAKVRPFSLSVLLFIAMTLHNIASFLSFYVVIPCALLVISYTLALTGLAAIATLRSLAVILETHYTVLAKKEHILNRDETGSIATSASTTSSSLIRAQSIVGNIRLLLKVVLSLFGIISLESLSINDIVFVKGSYIPMYFIICIPSFVTTGLLIGLVKPFQSCVDCDLFLELPIGVFACLAIYMTAAAVTTLRAYHVAGLDEKGVVKEMIVINLYAAPIYIVTWILMVVDPGEVEQDRKFNWSLLFFVATNIWIIVSYWYQLYLQWKLDTTASNAEIVHRQTYFNSHPDAKKEFLAFADKHFVSESLQFLDDINSYKQFFYEKGENWRLSKYKALVEMYILPGARLEVNISHAMKLRILKPYHTLTPTSKTNELFDIFNDAEKEIDRMIHAGIWSEFLVRRSNIGGRIMPVQDT